MNRRTALSVFISWLCSVPTLGGGSGELGSQAMEERTGGFVLRKFEAPFYSPMARQLGIEGRTTALAHISKDGKVTSVIHTDGHPLFQPEVSRALSEWQFEALGEVEGQVQITFRFILKGNRDQQILSYKVSGTLPSEFEIEVNPFPNNL